MAFYQGIRYEYADESPNNSRHSTASADPPLFRQEGGAEGQQRQHHFHLDLCNDPAATMPFPSPLIHKEEEESPTGMATNSFEQFSQHHQQITSSSSSSYYLNPMNDENQQHPGNNECIKQEHRQRQQYFPSTTAMPQNHHHHQQQLFMQEHLIEHEHHDPPFQHHHSKDDTLFYQVLQEQQENATNLKKSTNVYDGFPTTQMENQRQQDQRRGPPLRQMQQENISAHENIRQHRILSKKAQFFKELGAKYESDADAVTNDVNNLPAEFMSDNEKWQSELEEIRPPTKQPNMLNKMKMEQSLGSQDHHHPQMVIIGGGGGADEEDFQLDETMEEPTEKETTVKEPLVAPNGFSKPAYSYSCLIGLSLKNSSNGELTVSEIYTFLCHHFPYFREAPSGWKNSVRHNLSLNKCFKKIEVETPGSQGRKSCLWTMNPARKTKMDQELKKWRERDEARIKIAMENPENLDALQNGTMGMPAHMKSRRFGGIHPQQQQQAFINNRGTDDGNNNNQQRMIMHSGSTRRPPAAESAQHNQQRPLASSSPDSLFAPTAPPPTNRRLHSSFHQIQRPAATNTSLRPNTNSSHQQFILYQQSLHHKQQPLQPSNSYNNESSSSSYHHQQQQHEQQQEEQQKQRVESFHAQAARKLENLLKRQKSSLTSETADVDPPPPFTGLLIPPPEDGNGAESEKKRAHSRPKKRRSTESRRSIDEGMAPDSTDEVVNHQQSWNNRESTSPPKGTAPVVMGGHNFHQKQHNPQHHHYSASLYNQQQNKLDYQVEKERQAKAASFLYEQIMKSGNQRPKPESINNDYENQQPHYHPNIVHPHRRQNTNAIFDDLAVRIDQSSSSQFNGPSRTAAVAVPLPSPFLPTLEGNLGVDSCENALMHNQLLDYALQLSQSPK